MGALTTAAVDLLHPARPRQTHLGGSAGLFALQFFSILAENGSGWERGSSEAFRLLKVFFGLLLLYDFVGAVLVIRHGRGKFGIWSGSVNHAGHAGGALTAAAPCQQHARNLKGAVNLQIISKSNEKGRKAYGVPRRISCL